ncbi:unnamed protein product [Amaranthus hypochondriacus]
MASSSSSAQLCLMSDLKSTINEPPEGRMKPLGRWAFQSTVDIY